MTYADKLLTVIACQSNLNGYLIGEVLRQTLFKNNCDGITTTDTVDTLKSL